MRTVETSLEVYFAFGVAVPSPQGADELLQLQVRPTQLLVRLALGSLKFALPGREVGNHFHAGENELADGCDFSVMLREMFLGRCFLRHCEVACLLENSSDPRWGPWEFAVLCGGLPARAALYRPAAPQGLTWSHHHFVGGPIFSQLPTLYTAPVIYLGFASMAKRFRKQPGDGGAGGISAVRPAANVGKVDNLRRIGDPLV